MYQITYVDNGATYSDEYSDLFMAEGAAQDLAADGILVTLCQVLRTFEPRVQLPLECVYGVRPGIDYPGSFGGTAQPRRLTS